MGCRCQVIVHGNCESEDKFFDLYHHTGAEPGYMMPTIAKAHRAWLRSQQCESVKGRSECVSSFIVSSDPDGFVFKGKSIKPGDRPKFNGDLERIYIVNINKSKWLVDILETNHGFWEHPRIENTEVVAEGVEVRGFYEKMKREKRKERKLTETA